jgi:hypothetical protein
VRFHLLSQVDPSLVDVGQRSSPSSVWRLGPCLVQIASWAGLEATVVMRDILH